MKKVSIIIAIILFVQISFAQIITVEEYVQQHKDFAIREMKRMGIPAAITLAQGILETENGNSELVKKSNNHFGIKCKSTWTAAGVTHDDDALGECFRSYKCAEDSYRDHSNFLRGNDRYAFLFKLDPRDYKGWAYGLKRAGYATNVHYPEILIKNIEDNNLQQYTLEAVNEVPVFDASKYTSDPENTAIDEVTKKSGAENLSNSKTNSNQLMQFENKFFINGSPAIFAKKGTSLLAIATENNISLSKLLEYNDLDTDGILNKDQNIFLEKNLKRAAKIFYVLGPGETFYDASQNNGVRLENLYQYNSFSKNDIPAAGTKINLKPGKDYSQISNTSNPVDKQYIHAVQPKEGLFSISKKYGVTVSQIKEWNNLADDNLKVGQQLIVSVSR